MNAVRHIAGIPTDKEQRCVRCCEVIADTRTRLTWPGKYLVIIGYQIFADHPSAVDCAPYDPVPMSDEQAEAAERILA